jgi:hypothetical protein
MKNKKLELKRQAIRELSSRDMRAANGGTGLPLGWEAQPTVRMPTGQCPFPPLGI